MSRLRLHRFVPRTAAEGPGIRACVWVQGCSIRCPGCFSPHTWSPAGGHDVDVDDLARRIGELDEIEGVTFLGGEPFDQAEPLAELASSVRRSGLSVMTFSGHTLEHLTTAGRPEWIRLLSMTDLLVDGPYDWRRPDSDRPWVGSTNQRFHFLTQRYRELATTLHSIPDRIEIRLQPDGCIWINGMGSFSMRRDLRRAIEQT
jgi:anaerobic ribonucleoside-triphosphate reductase activating protein